MSSLKTKVQSLELVPGSGGIFEVSRDGETLFSKRETGRFPDWDEIKRAIG